MYNFQIKIICSFSWYDIFTLLPIIMYYIYSLEK